MMSVIEINPRYDVVRWVANRGDQNLAEAMIEASVAAGDFSSETGRVFGRRVRRSSDAWSGSVARGEPRG